MVAISLAAYWSESQDSGAAIDVVTLDPPLVVGAAAMVIVMPSSPKPPSGSCALVHPAARTRAAVCVLTSVGGRVDQSVLRAIGGT